MAGKLRIAAKVFLVSSVLAAGGAGAYYGTTVGWPALREYVASNAGAAVGDDASDSLGFAADDLDAVASAWAEPAPEKTSRSSFKTALEKGTVPFSSQTRKIGTVPGDFETAAIADSSPRARSAEVSAKEPVTVGASPEDRYGLHVATAATDVMQEVPAVAPSATEPISATDVQPQPLDADGEELSDDEEDAVAAEEPTPALARGQEPTEAIEPQPIVVPGQAQNINPMRSRGHEAVQDQQVVPAGDRYRFGGSASAESMAPAKDTGAAVANPFNSPTTPTAAASEPLQPLPGLPDETDAQLAELPANDAGPSAGAIQPLRGERTARVPKHAAPAAMGAGGQSAALEESFESQPIAPLAGESSAGEGFSQPSASSAQETGTEGTGRPGEKALEGPQRPALEIQKFAPAEIQVGKPAKFVVQVRNIGTQAADDVTVRDEIPHATRLISTSPSAKNEGNQLVWQLGKLSRGEDRTLEMQLMPTAEGELGSVATVSYAAQASVKTRCTMPQLAIRMTAPNKVLVGQEQRVKIELRNPGSGDATGVMLFENVPPTVRHAAGPTLEFEVGTLPAGETRELELVLLAEKAGKTVNVLTARADGNLQVQQQVEFEVIAPALAVDVSGPERRYLERPATYEVTVENPGTAPAHDVQIITKLPKGMQFVRANNLGEYDAGSHAVYWSLAELPEGERGTVEVVAMPTETGPQTLQVESRASQGLSGQAQQQIVVDGLAAIMFEVRDLEDPIEVGGETGYEIRIVNQGTKAAANVQVAVSLPPGMQLVSAEGETQHNSQRGIILFEPIPQLGPKADTVYRVRVQGTQAGDQRVAVEVNTDDLTQPIRREESTQVFGDE